MVSEVNRQPVDNPVRRVLRGGDNAGLANHTVLVRRDGRNLPVDDSGAPIRDAHGQLIGAVLIFRDISRRRAAELALSDSEERFRNLVTATSAVVWTAGPDGTFVTPQTRGRPTPASRGKNIAAGAGWP